MLTVRLGGGLRLEADGAELPPPASRRARGVLAYLALKPGPQPRGPLAATFWPDVLDESARTSLRAALTELRRALGPAAEALVATRDTVALEADVDMRAFVAADDPAARVAACRVPILDGFEEEWAIAARQAHLEELADALEQLAAAAADPAEAVRLTREQVALDPLAEEANRRLIERLAQAGDRSAALASGERFAERLRTALGIPPSRETRELLASLRRPAVPAPPPPPALARAYATEFVGREAELLRLRAAWGDVEMHRTRRLMLLAGEPGVGKTRLAHRFAADHLGVRPVLLGRCWEEPLDAFEPFAEALRQAGAADVLTPGDDGAGARHRLFDAVDAALSDLAAAGGLLLVLDDLHWADAGTLLLTSFLLRSDRPGPLLIVGTYRDTEIGRRSPLAGFPGDRIALHGLSERDVAALVGDPETGARVHARTDGNAFFVEQVLHAPAGAPAPESVRQAVGVRLSRLSDDAGELLAAASVLGQELDAHALAGMVGDAEAPLDEVLRERLLRPAGDGRFEFAHALVRETVYDELNVLRRARLHRAAAEALRALGEDRHIEEVASHLFQAASIADARQVADLLVQAGRRSLSRLAYEDAAARFERALEALAMADAQDESGPVLLARGDALSRAGDPAAARAVFDAAAALARRRGDAALLAEAALGYAGLGIAILDLDADTIARLEAALAALGTEATALRSRVQARLAVELYYAPDRSRPESLSADAVATAGESGDPSALASALNARHVALWRPDRVQERIDTATAMIAAARGAGEPHQELQARNWLVMDRFELGDMRAWREEVAAHARLADELRLPAFQWYAPLWAGIEAVMAGRWTAADALLAEAEAMGTRAGDRNAELFAGMIRELVVVERMDYGETDTAFLEDKIANSPAGPAYMAFYAWHKAATGDLDGGRRTLDHWMADDLSFDANWLSGQAEAAEAAVLLGATGHAEVLYERLLPYAGRPATAGRAAMHYGAIDRHLGILAALLGRREIALDHLRTALRLDAAMGATVWRLHTLRALLALAPDDELAAEADAIAAAVGLAR